MFAWGILMVWPLDLINFFALHPPGQTKARNKGGGGIGIPAAHVPLCQCHITVGGIRGRAGGRLGWASVVNMQMSSLIGLKRSPGSNSVITQCQIKSVCVCVGVCGRLVRAAAGLLSLWYAVKKAASCCSAVSLTSCKQCLLCISQT